VDTSFTDSSENWVRPRWERKKQQQSQASSSTLLDEESSRARAKLLAVIAFPIAFHEHGSDQTDARPERLFRKVVAKATLIFLELKGGLSDAKKNVRFEFGLLGVEDARVLQSHHELSGKGSVPKRLVNNLNILYSASASAAEKKI
jgi:hypothetical protein